MKSLWQPTLLAAFLILAGCATTTKHQVAVTGDIMVDAPSAIANGPPRDRSEILLAADAAGCFPDSSRLRHDDETPGRGDRRHHGGRAERHCERATAR